jgi:hypothetical protein
LSEYLKTEEKAEEEFINALELVIGYVFSRKK